MRTYYRGPDAHVTDERFIWRAETPRVFVVRDLRGVVLTRRINPDRRPDIAWIAAAVLAALAATSWLLVGVAVGAAVGILALIAMSGATATRRHRPAYLWQVRATYQGTEVVIYESGDVRVFNQVKRALRRTLEDNPPSRSAFGLAAA